ncbi:MAG: poly(R)-hydroxyalkanoic acid synthase subunit PhaE [Steroidobacteraceae bacterium]|jgi:class III poly(R)-hydroxyalkanoic acid synthase PhaE subunit
MAADQTPGPNEWAAAVQKTQEDVMRQWTEMANAWSKAASGVLQVPAAPPPMPPGGGADVAQKFMAQFEQYLGVSRSLWDLLGRTASVPEPDQRTRVFTEGLQSLQQQFAGLWGATAFGAPLSGAAMPFAGGGMGGMGGFGFPGMMPGAAPGFGSMFGGGNPFGFAAPGATGPSPWLSMPALGPAREQQESWQKLAQISGRVAQAQMKLSSQWNEIIALALRELGTKITPQLSSGAAPGSVKEVYDLWVNSAESAYARIAHGAAFIQAQSELTNALSQLRIAQRELLEDFSRQFDLPTRAELNSIHQQLRELKAALHKSGGG